MAHDNDKPRLWERPWIYIPLFLFCLLTWWLVICCAIKLWPR